MYIKNLIIDIAYISFTYKKNIIINIEYNI